MKRRYHLRGWAAASSLQQVAGRTAWRAVSRLRLAFFGLLHQGSCLRQFCLLIPDAGKDSRLAEHGDEGFVRVVADAEGR